MRAVAYALPQNEVNGKYQEMTKYLSSEGGYWLREDRWYTGADSFTEAGIKIAERGKNWTLADFRGYQSDNLKLEMKYYYLWSMKHKWVTAKSLYHNYPGAVIKIGEYLGKLSMECLDEQEGLPEPEGLEGTECQSYLHLYHTVARFITDFYDDRKETEKDVWKIAHIPGVNQSAARRFYISGISLIISNSQSMSRHR